MSILISGASGFLGRHICKHLHEQSLHFISVGRSAENAIQCDLSEAEPDLSPYQIDMVVHAAGKAHMLPKTEAEINSFKEVNLSGTRNLLKALDRIAPIRTFVFISSVSVYGLLSGENITEDHPLNATDIYGKSKIEAEQMILDWGKKKGAAVFILRLPLIAGDHPPGNLGAMIKGILTGRYLSIGKAGAKKSMVLADDVAMLIPRLRGRGGIYNLTDGYHPSFAELEKHISKHLHKNPPVNIPLWFAKILGICGDIMGSFFPINSRKLKKIILPLTFSDARARKDLAWQPAEILKSWNPKP